MATVTQRVPNFLGGVSTQPDELKKPGQLTDIVNGYPDVALGLLKRQGSKYVGTLTGGSNAGKWFSIFRDAAEQYVVCIGNGTIDVWDAQTGDKKTVNLNGGTGTYINSNDGENDYEYLTIYDQTFIVNKKKIVAKQADPTTPTNRNSTVVLRSVEYSAKYDIVVNGQTATVTTRNADDNIGPADPAKEVLSASILLTDLKSAIDALSISGLTVTKLDTSLELVISSGSLTVSAKGGQSGDAIEAYNFTAKASGAGTSVSTIASLPEKSINGRILKIANFSGSADDFYVKYISADNVYEETISPNASPGLDASTMPHVLVREANGTFTFKQVDWTDRLVGDDETNDHPSFLGRSIQDMFFFANRFGMLSGESVVMSRAGEFFNFYSQSAISQNNNDPIDINVSSIVPTRLHSVKTVPQGLLLFSKNEQFLMKTDTGIWSPKEVNVRKISSYENDEQITPVDMGLTVGFVSKSPSYTRVFELQTKGEDETPLTTELSKVVSEWIPSSIDTFDVSAQNSLLMLSSKSSEYIYLFTFYTEGEQRTIESWFRWKMIGKVVHASTYEDTVYVVTIRSDGSYWLQTVDLIQSPLNSQLVTADGLTSDVRLDMWAEPSSMVYDAVTKSTTVTSPYTLDASLPGRVIVTNSSNPSEPFTGQTYTVTPSGNNYIIPGDLTGKDVLVGFAYDFIAEFPRIYYSFGESGTDFTADLVISRIKVTTGLSGDTGMFLQSTGRDDWSLVRVARKVGEYLANTAPFTEGAQFTIPVHQRNINYNLKVSTQSPYPISLISMAWEGMYFPRYYRRT